MTSVSGGHIKLTPTQLVGTGGHSGDHTRDVLTRSRALYRLSYLAPFAHLKGLVLTKMTPVMAEPLSTLQPWAF